MDSTDDYERRVTRRELLRLGVAAGVASMWTPRGLLHGWQQQALEPTPFTVPGPFYPVLKPMDRNADLTRLRGHKGRAKGEVIQVVGRVVNSRGEPVRGAQIELWQANTFGRYDHPSDPNPAPLDADFQGYAVQRTDREGRYRFLTIKPGPYPTDASGRMRTPHIHLDVMGHTDRCITQLFFKGETLNDQDRVLQGVPRNRDALVAELLPAPAGEDPTTRLVRWDIVLTRG
jgi:protocatechuate 3,4-dioxygenase beta subunit